VHSAISSWQFAIILNTSKVPKKVQEQESSTGSKLNLYLILVLELNPSSEGKTRAKNYRQHSLSRTKVRDWFQILLSA